MKTTEPLVFGYEFVGPRKIDLPQSILESLDISSLAESPLTYNIRAADAAAGHTGVATRTTTTDRTTTDRTTVVGVREFSAPEGQVGMSAALAGQLDLKIGDELVIERVELPKGTQVTLRTATDAVNWKSLLESWLPRNCTALSLGDVLRIDYLGETHELSITALAPENATGAVCVVDTVMDLIIEADTAVAAEPTVQPLVLELNTVLELGPKPLLLSAPVPPDVRTLYVRSSEIAYIGPEYATSPSSFLAVASAPFGGEPTAVSTAFLGSSFSISGSGTLEVTTTAPASHELPTKLGDGERACPNCGKAIPEQSLLLHSSFCARNSVHCSICNRQFFGAREIPCDHWHCTRCNASGEGHQQFHDLWHDIHGCGGGKCACRDFEGASLAQLAFHAATTCPLRNKICQFCHLLLPQGDTSPVDAAQDLTGHESQCGNRTTDCPLCHKTVRLRSLKVHLLEHEEQRKQRKPPRMCSNHNCPNVIRSSHVTSPLGLCATCFGPLSVPGANTDVDRVLARVERRYLLQLTRGCGKSWCQNQSCKTGSGVTRSVTESMERVRQILQQDVQYFCVDETSTRKAMFVQLDDGIYDRGWRGMAISSCGTEAEASRWLEQNASRLNES